MTKQPSKEPPSAKNSPALNESQDQTIRSVPDQAAQVQQSSACKATPSAVGSDIWECTQCGLYGPWEGVICANCGTRAKPKS